MIGMANKELKSCGPTGHGHGYPGIHTQGCRNTTKKPVKMASLRDTPNINQRLIVYYQQMHLMLILFNLKCLKQ
jgi:hypothetical protein